MIIKSTLQKQIWLVICLYVTTTLLLLLVKFTAMCKLIFVTSSFGVGLYLYSNSPSFYLGFTYSLWFITAFIYRIGEFTAKDASPGFYMLAPCLVTLICSHEFFTEFPRHYSGKCLPFSLCLVSMIYGSFIAFLNRIPLGANLVALLQIVTPIFLCFYIFSNWENYPDFKKVIRKVFLVGSILMCLYGFFQRISIPAWDQYWINNIDKLGELGADNSLVAGIFSTTTGRQQFAAILLASLILSLCETNILIVNIISAVFFLAFLLTQARAAWFGFAASIFLFFFTAKQSFQIRVIITVCVSLIFLVVLASFEPFSSTISSRLETFSSLEDDGSLLNRQSAYSVLFGLAISEFFGNGLGFNVSTIATTSNFDGSIFQMLLFIGWIGVSFLLLGLISLLIKAFQGLNTATDTFYRAAQAIVLGIVMQLGFNFIFIGPHAVIMWSFLGLTLSGRQYFLQRNLVS